MTLASDAQMVRQSAGTPKAVGKPRSGERGVAGGTHGEAGDGSLTSETLAELVDRGVSQRDLALGPRRREHLDERIVEARLALDGRDERPAAACRDVIFGALDVAPAERIEPSERATRARRGCDGLLDDGLWGGGEADGAGW